MLVCILSVRVRGAGMKLLRLWMVAVTLCFAVGVMEARAAATVTVTQTSEGIYSVSVANIVNAAAINFVINYDAGALSDPVVNDSQLIAEAQAFREMNASNPGQLRVVYVSTKGFNKPGTLATVVFTRKGSVPARPPKLESEVYSATGTQTAVQPIVTQTAGTSVETVSSTNNSFNKTGNEVYQNAANMGSLPSRPSITSIATSDPVVSPYQSSGTGLENQPRPDSRSPEKSQEAPYEQSQSSNPAVEQDITSTAVADKAANKASDKSAAALLEKLKLVESVAERFRNYKGSRTLKGFAELFNDKQLKSAGFVQTPEIALSDGKRTVSLKVPFPADSGVPSFSLKGANLKNIKSLSDRLLELDAVPQKGKLDVRITIVFKKDSAEIPLFVVPPVSTGLLELSDAELEKVLLKPSINSKALPYDLNDDGKQDYLDDYILVAHWLLKQQNLKKPALKSAVPR